MALWQTASLTAAPAVERSEPSIRERPQIITQNTGEGYGTGNQGEAPEGAGSPFDSPSAAVSALRPPACFRNRIPNGGSVRLRA